MPAPRSRGADPTPSEGDADLERLLGRDRLEALIEQAKSSHGSAIRASLRAIIGEADRSDAGRLDQELRAAQRIQRALVGLTETSLEGWRLASEYQPAREIGGDFLDAFPILEDRSGTRLGLVIADVSGKGISAALLMAFVRPIIRAALDRTGDPREALERTNRILVAERRTGLFVTALCAVVELDTGSVRVANAGHEPPLIVGANGPPRWLTGGGPLLGAFRRLDLEEIRLQLAGGESLVAYTDGVTDATDAEGRRFGDDRLLAAVGRAAASADEISASVIAAMDAFRGTAEPADDVAILIARRDG